MNYKDDLKEYTNDQNELQNESNNLIINDLDHDTEDTKLKFAFMSVMHSISTSSNPEFYYQGLMYLSRSIIDNISVFIELMPPQFPVMLINSLKKEEFVEFQDAVFIFLCSFIDIYDDVQSIFNIQELFDLTFIILQNHNIHGIKHYLNFITQVIMKYQLVIDIKENNEVIKKFYSDNLENIIAINHFLIQYIRLANNSDQIHQIYEIIINNLFSINECSTFEVLLELFSSDENLIQNYLESTHFLAFLKEFNAINNEYNDKYVKKSIRFLLFMLNYQNGKENGKNIANLINFMNLCEMFETTDSNNYFNELIELFICILDSDPKVFLKLFIDNNIVIISIDEFIHGTYSRSVIIIKLIKKLFAYIPEIMLDYLFSASFFQTNNILSISDADSLDFCIFIFDIINFAKTQPDKLENIIQQLENSGFLEDLNELMDIKHDYFGEIGQEIINIANKFMN